MKFETPYRHSRANEAVSVVTLSAEEQTRKVHDAVARRAYQISETSKDEGHHELQDWLQAESDLVHPFCVGRMPIDGSLWLGTDADAFAEGTIEVWVAPRQLTVCGNPRTGSRTLSPGQRFSSDQRIYEVINLPVEVDPSRVAARVNCSALEILLRKAECEKESGQRLKMAA